MKLEGGERLVLKTLLDLQGDTADYVHDARLASTTKMIVEDVRDWLETLEGKGFVERSRGTEGFRAYVTAKGKQALRLTEPILNPKSVRAEARAGDTLAQVNVDSTPHPSKLEYAPSSGVSGSVQPSAVPIPAVNAEPPGQAIEPSSRLTGIQPSLDPAGSPEPPPDVDRNGFQVVLLIHGIRTEADWGPMVRSKLEVPGQIEVIPIRYGYFDAFRFWFPFWTRNKPVERVYEQMRVALQKYKKSHPGAKLSIIAHSFGTYIIGEILKRGFDLQIYRLLLCGSVLPQDFLWHQYQGRFDDDKVVNECGKSDIWPVLAQSASWGYGASGTHGFGAVLVKDRYHAGGHGQYFEPEFVEKYWGPFIRRGEYKGTEFETKIPPTPWWLSVLGVLPLRWLIGLMLIASVVLAGYFLKRQYPVGMPAGVRTPSTRDGTLKGSPGEASKPAQIARRDGTSDGRAADPSQDPLDDPTGQRVRLAVSDVGFVEEGQGRPVLDIKMTNGSTPAFLKRVRFHVLKTWPLSRIAKITYPFG
jgi:DNA-binding MarR family transcriptional regulator